MDSILFRAVSWSFVMPSVPKSGRSSIQAFGYNQNGESVYIKIPYFSTLLVKYNEEISKDDLIELQLSLGALDVVIGENDNTVAIITDPTSNLMDVVKDEENILDPYGVYATFFQRVGIEPYETLLISKYKNFQDITTQQHHYNAISSYIKGVDEYFEVPTRLFFWDIETYTDADEFTNPNRDPVTLISVVTVVGDKREVYLLSRIKVDKMDDVKILYFTDEKKLIEGFYTLWIEFKPDKSITYNGLSYDIPYMIARASKLGIKIGQLGKIKNLNAWTDNHIIPTPIGTEYKKRLVTPGVEEIDLILYFRLKYPHLPNHKLDTVAYNLLGEGKTGLTIDRMFEIFRKGDPKEMKEAAEYSVMDVILLDKLYVLIVNDLESTANNFAVTIEDLLLSNPKDIIDKQIYHIDPSLYFYSVSKNKEDFTIAPQYGVYTDVHIYDYSELLNEAMLNSKDKITTILAKRTKGVGITLTKALWDSRVTKTDYRYITKHFDSINEIPSIVEVNKNILATINKINRDFLCYKYTCSYYIILSNVSRYIIYNDEDKACIGRSNICKPRYSLEEDLVKDWLESIANNEDFKYLDISMNNLSNEDVPLFVKTIKVHSHDEYSNVVMKKQLFEQVSPITTFKNVRYVMTKRGAEVYNDQYISEIDIDHYRKELKNLYTKLRKISGVNNVNVFY